MKKKLIFLEALNSPKYDGGIIKNENGKKIFFYFKFLFVKEI